MEESHQEIYDLLYLTGLSEIRGEIQCKDATLGRCSVYTSWSIQKENERKCTKVAFASWIHTG